MKVYFLYVTDVFGQQPALIRNILKNCQKYLKQNTPVQFVTKTNCPAFR